MNEAFLQYIWAQRLYKTPEMLTTQHRQITVLNPGRLNTDAGPDFFNAQVKINGITWAGNVEIHLTSDDWYRHGHETDAAYNNVILHVVARSTGREVRNSHGEVISEVVLDYDPTLLEKYQELKPDLTTMDITMPEMDGISAVKEIKKVDPNAKIVMCSAMGQQAMVIEAIQAGARDFIVKPFQADRVLEAVRKAVG